MLLYSPKMDIQLVQVLQQGSKGRSLGHLGKGVDILGEALAAITKLTIWTRNVSMGIIDITREQNTCMHLAPVSPSARNTRGRR